MRNRIYPRSRAWLLFRSVAWQVGVLACLAWCAIAAWLLAEDRIIVGVPTLAIAIALLGGLWWARRWPTQRILKKFVDVVADLVTYLST